LAISLAMVATAGGAGYGLVRVAQTAGRPIVASMQAPSQRPQAVAGPHATAPSISIAALGHATMSVSPAQQAQTLRLAQSVPPLQIDPSVPDLVYVAAAPPHPLVLPINFGRPHAPEDDAPAQSATWHHHALSTRHHRSFVCDPAGSDDDQPALQQAQQIVSPAQGESDSDMNAAAPSPDQAENDAAPSNADGESAPVQQADSDVPGATQAADVQYVTRSANAEVGRLIVPASASHRDLPAYRPAERIDPTDAASADRASDAAFVLATVKRAPASPLAVPAYPTQLADEDRPGRVDVGCVISQRGLPSGCEVQRQEGGRSFAHAVMSWLRSGNVRYRPSVVDGQPAAEPRDYKVRFEP
jgi:hypothetical protein